MTGESHGKILARGLFNNCEIWRCYVQFVCQTWWYRLFYRRNRRFERVWEIQIPKCPEVLRMNFLLGFRTPVTNTFLHGCLNSSVLDGRNCSESRFLWLRNFRTTPLCPFACAGLPVWVFPLRRYTYTNNCTEDFFLDWMRLYGKIYLCFFFHFHSVQPIH